MKPSLEDYELPILEEQSAKIQGFFEIHPANKVMIPNDAHSRYVIMLTKIWYMHNFWQAKVIMVLEDLYVLSEDKRIEQVQVPYNHDTYYIIPSLMIEKVAF